MKKQNSAFSEFSNVHGSACLTSGRRMSGARLSARRPRLARRLAAAVHGALLVSVGAVARASASTATTSKSQRVCQARAWRAAPRLSRAPSASSAQRARRKWRSTARTGCRATRVSAHGSAARSSSASNVAASTAARRGWRVRPASAGRHAASERTRAALRARTKGSYEANKQWAKRHECVSECSAGFHNDKTQYTEGCCRHCWDCMELALHAGLEQQFFALFACNATSNACWAPCAQE